MSMKKAKDLWQDTFALGNLSFGLASGTRVSGENRAKEPPNDFGISTIFVCIYYTIQSGKIKYLCVFSLPNASKN